jgi:hypothetical protein
MIKQRNCKICNCEEWLSDYFVLAYHVERLTYQQIIEVFEKYGVHLNVYNINCHLHRHVEQKDLRAAEAKKARWDAYDAKHVAD